MRTVPAVSFGVLLTAALALGAGAVYVRSTGLTTRGVPGRVEMTMARTARRLAVPAAVRDRVNPVAPTDDALAEGMAHFADHCAVCHANNGSGDTEMGHGFYPPAPDMRLPATQELTDGELFYIIENGVRFTGMPGWGTGTAAGEESSWRLVQFLRHLPRLTGDEIERMESLNPRSAESVRQEIEEERFLRGEQE
jgi:mono/diheme cytochrome c family protein